MNNVLAQIIDLLINYVGIQQQWRCKVNYYRTLVAYDIVVSWLKFICTSSVAPA